jgi:hypothetical protein
MGITKNMRVFLYITVAALALSACAKRDNSALAARKNAAGATNVGGAQSDAADAAAAAAGYNTDILVIQQPQMVGNALTVTSYIKVNNNNYKIVTTHNSVNTVSKTQQTFDGANFEVNGVCPNANCSPYYLVINITRSNQQIKQTAMKKFFYYTDASSSQDLFLSRGAGEFLSVQDAITTLDSAVVDGTEPESMYTKAQ